MSKKTTNNTEQTQAQNPQVEELMTKGKIVVSAKTREELLAKVSAIITECKTNVVCAGAVGQNYEAGGFTQRLDVIDKK